MLDIQKATLTLMLGQKSWLIKVTGLITHYFLLSQVSFLQHSDRVTAYFFQLLNSKVQIWQDIKFWPVKTKRGNILWKFWILEFKNIFVL